MTCEDLVWSCSFVFSKFKLAILNLESPCDVHRCGRNPGAYSDKETRTWKAIQLDKRILHLYELECHRLIVVSLRQSQNQLASTHTHTATLTQSHSHTHWLVVSTSVISKFSSTHKATYEIGNGGFSAQESVEGSDSKAAIEGLCQLLGRAARALGIQPPGVAEASNKEPDVARTGQLLMVSLPQQHKHTQSTKKEISKSASTHF